MNSGHRAIQITIPIYEGGKRRWTEPKTRNIMDQHLFGALLEDARTKTTPNAKLEFNDRITKTALSMPLVQRKREDNEEVKALIFNRARLPRHADPTARRNNDKINPGSHCSSS